MLMSAAKLIAVRDPTLPPACYGIMPNGAYNGVGKLRVSAVGAEFIRDILPGDADFRP